MRQHESPARVERATPYGLNGDLLHRDNITTGDRVSYLRVGGMAIAEVTNAGVATYYHNDQLGSPVSSTDASGSILWREQYTPFGQALQSDAAHADNIGSTGHIEDASGLTYMQARYYDPVVGRFLQTDPAGYENDLNLYGYVSNNPLNAIDPSGRDGLTFGLEGWNVGDHDPITGQALPPAYTGLGVAAGFNERGDFEVGAFMSHAEGDAVVGEGFGVLAGPGGYHGDIEDMERTTHTAIGALGVEGGSVTVKADEGGLSRDPFAVSLPRTPGSTGIGLGGAMARPNTRTASAVLVTREQMRDLRGAVSSVANQADGAARQGAEFVRTAPDRIRQGLGLPIGAHIRR